MYPRNNRFIPTPVGNADYLHPDFVHKPVHPHARGERPDDLDRLYLDIGSSPRPWGTRTCPRPRYGGFRFIPTPVGNAM